MKNWNALAMLVFFVAICLAVGGLGAIAVGSSVDQWYSTLRKPSWTPPSSVFGPVWTTLYVLMAIAAWLVWGKRDAYGAKAALWMFVLQLALNAAWSPLFFGLRNPLTGLLDIVFLCVALVVTTVSFWRISPAAGVLLIPYTLWVCFAAVLNLALWRMNR
jgi:benzodiazapine receptor